MKDLFILITLTYVMCAACSKDDADDPIDQPRIEIDLSDQDQEAIYNLRMTNNDAIARHDATGVADPYIHNFFILTSTNGFFEGKETVRDIYQSVFDGRVDVIFVRTPDHIRSNTDWNMASEHGSWVGSWKVDGDEINVGGDYYAKWHKIDGSWKLRSEVYTQFDCDGEVVCNNKPLLE